MSCFIDRQFGFVAFHSLLLLLFLLFIACHLNGSQFTYQCLHVLLLLLHLHKFKNDELELNVDQLSSGLPNKIEPKTYFYQKKSNMLEKFRSTVVYMLAQVSRVSPRYIRSLNSFFLSST